jgi:hypothetical protein
MVDMATDMLEAYGEDVEFKIKVDQYKNKFTGGKQSSDVSVFVKGIQSNVSDFIVDYSNIKTGDKTITIPANKGIPLPGSEIKIGGQLHRVLNVIAEAPTGVALYYQVKARSYALVEDTETITMELGEMDLGTVVVDPNRQDTPQWLIVGHGHYKSGTTTLMTTNLVTDNEPFAGASGRWPLAPWSETWIRKYLLGTFKNTLSAKMIKNLQVFTVTTLSQRSTDTISMASNQELGYPSTPGISNGEPFEYFTIAGTDLMAANSNRIASFDNSNTAYWTRDGIGVAADGSFVPLNQYYGHGVRAVITFLSGIEATYNAAGEFELKLS